MSAMYSDGLLCIDRLPEQYEVAGIPDGATLARLKVRPQEIIRAYIRNGGRFEEWRCEYEWKDGVKDGLLLIRLMYCTGTNFRP